jgi:hypothetical protein
MKKINVALATLVGPWKLSEKYEYCIYGRIPKGSESKLRGTVVPAYYKEGAPEKTTREDRLPNYCESLSAQGKLLDYISKTDLSLVADFDSLLRDRCRKEKFYVVNSPAEFRAKLLYEIVKKREERTTPTIIIYSKDNRTWKRFHDFWWKSLREAKTKKATNAVVAEIERQNMRHYYFERVGEKFFEDFGHPDL